MLVEREGLVHHLWECGLVQPLQRKAKGILRELGIELPCDQVLLLLDVCLKEAGSLSREDICTPCSRRCCFGAQNMEAAWCPLVDGWVDTVCICGKTLLSHGGKKVLPFAMTWIDLKSIMPDKVGQTEKDK